MKKSFFLSLLIHGVLIAVLMGMTFGPEPQPRNIPIRFDMFTLPNEPMHGPLPTETVPAVSKTAHKKIAEPAAPKTPGKPAAIPVTPKTAETQPPKDEAKTAKTQAGTDTARQESQAQEARRSEEANKAEKTAEEARKRAEAEAMAAENARLEGLREAYISSLRTEIERNKKYPVLSKAKGEEGKTVLAFRVLKNGQIVNARMISTSSFEKLDAAALKALEKVGVFRHIPPELQEDFMDITVPVSFKSQGMKG